MHDAAGNVGQLVAWTTNFGGAQGNAWHADRLVARYEYDPYGRIMAQSGFYAAANPFRWSTKRFDPETALSDFGMRYYSATLGRWLNRDPIGDFGGANVYAYVGNNPTNFSDYLGLASASCRPGEPCHNQLYSGGGEPPDEGDNNKDKKPCPKKPEDPGDKKRGRHPPVPPDVIQFCYQFCNASAGTDSPFHAACVKGCVAGRMGWPSPCPEYMQHEVDFDTVYCQVGYKAGTDARQPKPTSQPTSQPARPSIFGPARNWKGNHTPPSEEDIEDAIVMINWCCGVSGPPGSRPDALAREAKLAAAVNCAQYAATRDELWNCVSMACQ